MNRMKKNWCYKVVRKIKKKYFSSIVTGKYQKEYKINKKTTASRLTGGLFVFRTLKSAERFMDAQHFKTFEILLCECSPKTLRTNKRMALFAWNSFITRFWTKAKLDKRHGHPTPSGTFLTRWVIPKEIVS